MIFIKSLYKKFKHKDILTDCSFSLSSKGLYILTGDNGIGKTTLLNILSLNDSNYSGEIFFDEEKVDFSNSKLINKLKNNIEYLDQKNNFISYLDYLENYNLDTYLFKDTINSDISIKSQSLSDGEKIILLIDRCILRNKPIVLIDEAELHLHPTWQQVILPGLIQAFRGLQFIVTTHSPQVVSTVARDAVRLLNDKVGTTTKVIYNKPEFETKGRQSSDILSEVMQTHPRPDVKEKRWLSECYRLILSGQEEKRFEVEALLKKIRNHFGEMSVEYQSLANLTQQKVVES